MSTRRGKLTRYPGVFKTAPGRYLLRAKPIDPKTRRPAEKEWRVKARNASDASEERARRIAECERDARREIPRLRIFARSWLTGKLATLRPSTRTYYATNLDLHIIPAFGEWFIDTITHEDVVSWRDSMSEAGAEPESVNGRLRTLKTLLADAAGQLGLSTNPAARVKPVPKRPVEDDDAGKCLTVDELRRLLAAVEEVVPQWYPLTLALALTGARWGAVTALRWDDLDFDEGVIRFRRAHWRNHLNATKTGILRTLPLAPQLGEVLQKKRRHMIATQARGLEDGWIFPSKVGRLPTSGVLRKPLDQAIARAELDKRPGVHWFRHTLNNLIRQVATKDVQKSITGHLTDEMAEHYSHVAMSEKRAAIGHVVHLLGSGEK